MSKKVNFKNISGADAIQDLLFPVRMSRIGLFDKDTKQVIAADEETQDFRAVVRTDTNHMIAVPSAQYVLLSNEDYFRLIDEAIGELGLVGKIRRVGYNGRMARMKVSVEFPDLSAQVGDSVICYNATLTNSYDGAFKTGFEHGLFRLICENGWKIGDVFDSWFRRHIGSLEGALKDFIEGFGWVVENFNDVISRDHELMSRALMKKHATPEKFFEDFREASKLPKKYVDQMVERAGLPDSAQPRFSTYWAAWQAVTWVLSHNVKETAFLNEDALLERSKSAMLELMPATR